MLSPEIGRIIAVQIVQNSVQIISFLFGKTKRHIATIISIKPIIGKRISACETENPKKVNKGIQLFFTDKASNP